MSTVKSTLFPDSKNRSVYFDVDEGIRLCEKRTGKKIEGVAAEILRSYAPLINRAYNDGLRDGMRGGAAWAS